MGIFVLTGKKIQISRLHTKLVNIKDFYTVVFEICETIT